MAQISRRIRHPEQAYHYADSLKRQPDKYRNVRVVKHTERTGKWGSPEYMYEVTADEV